MEEVLDSKLEGLPEASVVKLLRERLNRVNVVCMMMESLTFEIVFFSTSMPEFPIYGFVKQCCHDPGLTRSDPDPPSSDPTLIDWVMIYGNSLPPASFFVSYDPICKQ